MRCPKCGYLSFDHLEICRGCRKNIAKISEGLTGVVLQHEVPDFLRFEVEEEPEGADAETGAMTETEEVEPEEAAADLQDDTVEFSADIDPLEAPPPAPEELKEEIEFALPDAAEEQAEEIAFALPDEEENPGVGKAPASPDADAGIDMSLDDLGGLELETDIGAASAMPEPSAKSKLGGQDKELSSLDLGGLDLSMSSEGEKEDFSIGELSLERPEPGSKAEKGGKPGKPGKKTTAAGASAKGGLPDLDLRLEGMDLASTVSSASGGAAGKKAKTAELKSMAKTGTALDDFEFDLGELVAGKVEKPMKPAAPAKTAVKKK